jgi:hypothetical protein
MGNLMNKIAFALAFVFTALVFTAPARAETVNCTAITSLPAIITVQGIYCVTGDLTTAMSSGNAITINTNNVVFDMNGFKLGGLSAGPGTNAIGICAIQRQNITIKNGTIRGFLEGILLGDARPYTTSQGHIIEDIRADQNTYIGFEVRGVSNIVRSNHVLATGGTTAFGVNAYGYGIIVAGNVVRRFSTTP